MRFVFALMEEAEARTIAQWRYGDPYAVYNRASVGVEDVTEELDRRSPYYAVCDERGTLVGFFNVGTSAEVSDCSEPGLYGADHRADHSMAIGFGLRPDLTGRGLGGAFVAAGLAFARAQFAPSSFRLYVLAWNERAIRVYERAGFARTRDFTQRNIHGQNDFVEMRRPA